METLPLDVKRHFLSTLPYRLLLLMAKVNKRYHALALECRRLLALKQCRIIEGKFPIVVCCKSRGKFMFYHIAYLTPKCLLVREQSSEYSPLLAYSLDDLHSSPREVPGYRERYLAVYYSEDDEFIMIKDGDESCYLNLRTFERVKEIVTCDNPLHKVDPDIVFIDDPTVDCDGQLVIDDVPSLYEVVDYNHPFYMIKKGETIVLLEIQGVKGQRRLSEYPFEGLETKARSTSFFPPFFAFIVNGRLLVYYLEGMELVRLIDRLDKDLVSVRMEVWSEAQKRCFLLLSSEGKLEVLVLAKE